MPYTPIPNTTAPSDGRYLTTQSDSTLSNEFSLGSLTSGLLKHTVSGGVSTPATAVANTDYLAPDWDVISRQTLGADAQDITIALAGNTDERYLIQGYGPTNGGGNSFTLRVNDNATVVTYAYYYTTVGAAVALATDGAGFTYDQGTGFTIIFDAALITGSQRGGFTDGWSRNTSGSVRGRWTGAFNWSNTADNVTQLIIRGTDANTWTSGFKIIVLKRKFSA